MPDIARVEELCDILHLSMDELLGKDHSQAVRKVMAADPEDGSRSDIPPVSIDEINELAPILPPDKVEELAAGYLKQNPEEEISFPILMGLAPFLKKEYLDSLARRARISSLYEWIGLAPFLSGHTLNERVMASDLEVDLTGLTALAPFLSDKTLDQLFWLLPEDEATDLTGLLPFLPQKTLREYAEMLMQSSRLDALKTVMPFLKET